MNGRNQTPAPQAPVQNAPTPPPPPNGNMLGRVLERVSDWEFFQVEPLRIILALISAVLIAMGLIIVAGEWITSLLPTWLVGIVMPLILSGIIAGIVIWSWHRASDGFRQLATQTPTKQILIGSLIATVILMLVWLLSGIHGQTIESTGVSPRHAWIVAALLGGPTFIVFWLIFSSPTDLPGNFRQIVTGTILMVTIAVAFFGWLAAIDPNPYFEIKTGQARFWVGENEGKEHVIVNADGTTESKRFQVYYFPVPDLEAWEKMTPEEQKKATPHSPATKELLKLGTPEHTKFLLRDSWPKEVVQEVAAVIPEISMPSLPAKTTQVETAAEITVAHMKPHVIYPNQWTEIVLRPGLKNELMYEGSAQFADRSGNILYEGPYSPYMMSDVVTSRLWVRSLDQTKPLTQATPG